MKNYLTRGEFLKLAIVAGLAPFVPLARKPSPTAREWIVTGLEVPELAVFDDTMRDFMQARTIPGAALAVTRNGKLVLARGYTFAEHIWDIIVQPVSMFRIASISKPLTAVAILRLAQEGLLDLQSPVTDLLTLTPPPGETADPRLGEVTVINLLQHLGGWNRNFSFDPMFFDHNIVTDLGVSYPISQADIITYTTGKPLQHNPGSTYAYSNYGYCLLGRIIEALTGETYAGYISRAVFRPLDLSRPRLGRTLIDYRLPDEVMYHTQYVAKTVMDDSGEYVSWAYGGFNLENMDSHGGWLASAVDLARFACAFDNPASSPLLSQASIDFMFGLPENIDPGSYIPGDWYYGCGWACRDWGNGVRNTWHDGSLDGTHTLLVRRNDGLNWCVLFNQRDDPSGLSYWEIDGLLHTAADAVTSWPDHDLFEAYLFDEKSYLPLIRK